MPSAMPQGLLKDTVVAAAKEMDRLKHPGPLGQGDLSQDQEQNLGGGSGQVLSQGGLGQNKIQYILTNNGQIPIF